jgi:hypothetical protein
VNILRKQKIIALRVGDFVEVRTPGEILATLDENGALESLPFMPEMLQYCGRRFRVSKTAHKCCDTIVRDGTRYMDNAVHLDLRCDGQAHDGCQAGCLLFWKEAWLKRVARDEPANLQPMSASDPAVTAKSLSMLKTKQAAEGQDDTNYICQATEMRKATRRLPWWDLRQYYRDIVWGNCTAKVVFKGLLVWLFNRVQQWRGGASYPLYFGTKAHLRELDANNQTPHQVLDLKPGEAVKVKSRLEILQTLDKRDRNRGLSFDREMVRYCGGQYRVLRRIEKVIDDRTAKMVSMRYPCIVLDGVVCSGEYNRFCPRAVYPFWREIWLQRLSRTPGASANSPCVEDETLVGRGSE